MSGPVTPADTPPESATAHPQDHPCVELIDSHEARVGELTVRRALPRRARRTVGAWCFADHMGPAAVTPDHSVDVGPHPHTGLHTVTWLLEGEILHRDSLGSEQLIRPGQLNLMTAGHGVSHSEEATGRYRGTLHGIQLWIAQPEATRHGAPGFEHHTQLPALELAGGTATVIVGALGDATSPAHRDSDLVGAELALRTGTSMLPAVPSFEYAVVVLDGEVSIGGHAITPGHLAYLGSGHDELAFAAGGASRVVLLGGVPLDEPILMWWNFVARTRDEMFQAYDDWSDATERFGTVASPLARIPASPPPWRR